jgi:uncharacterized protein (TIGR03086 family)
MTAAAALFGGVALLERAVGYTLGQIQVVTPAALSRRTPCREWDVRALLAHMDDSLATMQEAMDLRYVDPEARADAGHPEVSLVAALRTRACRLLGALAGAEENVVWVGGYPVPVRVVTSAGAIDVAVHGWDVGRACGTGRPIPEELALDILPILPLLVTGADRPGRFAEPVPVPPGATAGDRLVAYLGRDPGWHVHHPLGCRV